MGRQMDERMEHNGGGGAHGRGAWVGEVWLWRARRSTGGDDEGPGAAADALMGSVKGSYR